MQKVSKTGVLLDNRTNDEKNKDYLHEELAMGFEPFVWEKRAPKQSYYYPYNQASSLSCVAGGGAIILEHFDGQVISRKDIYNGRVNYPSGGMMMSDVNEKIRRGACTENLVPSQNLSENKMNERYTITNEIVKSRAKNKVRLTIKVTDMSIDTLASITKVSPIIAFWYFDEAGKEWWTEYPRTMFDFKSNVQAGVTRHQVAIIDAILFNNTKYLVLQDTAGVGTGLGEHGNLRLVDEAMLKRLYDATYAIDDDDDILKPEPIKKPVYKHTKPLSVGSRGQEVKDLQAVLIYEGLLKIKSPTDYFGGLTRKAVIAFQEKYRDEILKPSGLKSGTGYVGSQTIKFLNKKYA